MSVVEGRHLLQLLLMRMVHVIVMSVMMMMVGISVVAARATPTVAVGRVAAVRRTVLLVYQVLYERHDRLALV